MTDRLHSYSSIYAIGHRAAADLFVGPVVVEEKLDGSQFSFGVTEDGETLLCRSKGADIFPENPEKMFAKAVESVLAIRDDLTPGWTYRGEYFQKPKHNTIAYGRVPEKHIILFDVDTGLQDYLDPDAKRTEAGRLGLEVVPTIFEGHVSAFDDIKAMMRTESVLGGATPEGLVFKNYGQFGPDKKTLMGKYVTEEFKEVHKGEWKKSNPGHGDIVSSLITQYRTPARWKKAVHHLRDAGVLTESPKDIPALMKEINVDVLKECEQDIKDALFAWAWPKIGRGITAGAPQWWKDELAQSAFAEALPEDHD